ncbi:hypothetical protein D9613_006684 [Agrocybe pediades]|uniref:tripeptidyl-peptidase II n=1 Tax=Agrocybe pediades TaxID=84607 RepID=A0A8H4QGW3_9AGAR|nr:hypothetical protein D9613_006684 [Agrocybe pediades]
MAPHPDSISAVNDWLKFHGIDPSTIQRSAAGDWLTLPVSVAKAERMLNTKYHIYEHTLSGKQVVRALSYSLPRELHSHIDVITPTTYFGSVRSMKKTSFVEPSRSKPAVSSDAGQLNSYTTVPASCNNTINPGCLRALYGTSSYMPSAKGVNKICVAGFLDEFANRADLQAFLYNYRPDAVNSTFTTVSVNQGGDNQADPGVEANLDIQYTTSLTYPTPNIYYSTGGSPPFNPDSSTPNNTNEPHLDLLNYLLSQKTLPQTLTASYGENEQTVPRDYAIKVCNMIAALTARGTTVFYSSGDYGVGDGDCKNNDGTNTTAFQPAFPASCPYVTAVGSTYHVNPEVGIDFSGGGFSRYFDMPSYQKKAVDAYLGAIGPDKYKGLFNRAGRAYPDVSAQGNNFEVIVGGRVVPVGGTSASAPTVASIFSLLNDYRISKGKKPLGFINPLIYSLAAGSGFADITSGTNPGCNTTGFSAREGWDPVTGLGTPKFKALKGLI